MPESPSFFQRITREREEFHRVLHVVRGGLQGLMKSQIPRMAAALAYRTIFAIIPVLVVGMVVVRSFVKKEELRSQLESLLAFVAFDRIALDGKPKEISEGTEGADGGAGVEPLVPAPEPEDGGDVGVDGGLDAMLEGPGGTIELDSLLTDLVEKMSSAPLSAIGFVGLLVLIYAALTMLVELEKAFNQIYRAPSGRAWSKRVVVYWTTLTLGVLLLIATFSVSSRMASRFELGTLGGLVMWGVNVVINTGLLLLAYTTMPNARVRFRAAFAGAVVGGLIWELAKMGFTRYVAFATDGLERFYGAIALLPLFLLWVYLTWMIVLFGLQVAYALQHAESWRTGEEQEGLRLLDPGSFLLLLTAVARRFREGESSTVQSLSAETRLDERTVSEMMEPMFRARLLQRVELPGDAEGVALTRPAERIGALDVLAAGEAMMSATAEGPVVATLRAAREDVLGGKTLADLLNWEL